MTPGLSSTLTPLQPAVPLDSPIVLTWALANHGPGDVLVVSHYATSDRRHFDPLTLRLVRQRDGRAWEIALSGPRKAAARIACLLRPGDTLRHEIDLRYWAGAAGVTLEPGVYAVTARYSVAETAVAGEWATCNAIDRTGAAEPALIPGPPRDVWRGDLDTGTAVIRVGP